MPFRFIYTITTLSTNKINETHLPSECVLNLNFLYHTMHQMNREDLFKLMQMIFHLDLSKSLSLMTYKLQRVNFSCFLMIDLKNNFLL